MVRTNVEGLSSLAAPPCLGLQRQHLVCGCSLIFLAVIRGVGLIDLALHI